MDLLIPEFVKKQIKVPFVPSTWEAAATMVALSEPKKGQRMVDLGSGDGRIIISFAREGVEANGYETNERLVEESRENILRENLGKFGFVHEKDYWEEDLSLYDIITIYGMSSMMERLEEKLDKELKPGAKVVSNIFTFPHWKSKEVINNVYLYLPKE